MNIEEYKKIAEKYGDVWKWTPQYILNDRGQKILRTQLNATQGKQNEHRPS